MKWIYHWAGRVRIWCGGEGKILSSPRMIWDLYKIEIIGKLSRILSRTWTVQGLYLLTTTVVQNRVHYASYGRSPTHIGEDEANKIADQSAFCWCIWMLGLKPPKCFSQRMHWVYIPPSCVLTRMGECCNFKWSSWLEICEHLWSTSWEQSSYSEQTGTLWELWKLCGMEDVSHKGKGHALKNLWQNYLGRKRLLHRVGCRINWIREWDSTTIKSCYTSTECRFRRIKLVVPEDREIHFFIRLYY